MDYDFRTRSGTPYDAQFSMYRSPPTLSPSPASHPMYAPPLYPKIAQQGHPAGPPGRPSPHPQTSAPSSSSGIGIRIAIKPEYRITPPPHLTPHGGDISRSNFQFDFDFERKILAEAEKESPEWSKFGMENLPTKTPESTSSVGSVSDPIVSKYIGMGLNRQAVSIAVANYGDNPTKVREFVNSYTLLREMGFSSNSVAEALVMYENDTDKALAHFLNGSS
ncbi:hypothetical protein L6164_030376 [Bauhinia variegata]|uniref:Uncharacterized protein n=1 Tax=Bauhinia variegata TaxID=167791 RepID=A0ACB9LBQ3_BAUVA|nr:hypothetical protein L6164_030376 [Bauhinia variegata]